MALSLRNTKVGHSPPAGTQDMFTALAQVWVTEAGALASLCNKQKSRLSPRQRGKQLSWTPKTSHGNAPELSYRNSQDGFLGRMFL